MRHRRQQTPPLSSLERARKELADAEKQLREAQAAQAAAGRVALSLAERQQRTAALKRAIGEVAMRRDDVVRESRDPAREAEVRRQVREAHRNTIDYGLQAVRVIADYTRRTGKEPDYTITAKKVTYYDLLRAVEAPGNSVEGWLLFDAADYRDIEHFPQGSYTAIHIPLYHGPLLRRTGQVSGFYDLITDVRPGVSLLWAPVRLGDDRTLKLTDYSTYQERFHRDDPLSSEYAVQQHLADLVVHYSS